MNPKARAMLTELADLLDTLPPERFDYGRWVGDDWKGAPDLSCGTTACAAGWATTLLSFREAGLRLVRAGEGIVATNENVSVDAMAEVLGIAEADARFLFVPGAYSYSADGRAPGDGASAAEVAEHIRRFLRVTS